MNHMLVKSGAAFAAPDCMKGDCLVFYREQTSPPGSVKGDGHALCTCGVRSPHLKTYRDRKTWLKEHIAETEAVRACA